MLKQPFPLALRYLRDDKQNVNNLITAAVKFSERHGHGVDANDEYQRHHRHRRLTREVDERPETAKNLILQDFYRKEFIQFNSSTYKHKPLPTMLKRHVIFLPRQLSSSFIRQ